MDINSLKEIDIIAFGPRARIAKAIKELRSAYEPPSSLSAPGSADSGSLRRGSQQIDRFSTEPIPENEALDTRSYGALGFQSSNSPHGSIGMGRTPSNNTATPRSSHAPNDGDVEELQPASAGREVRPIRIVAALRLSVAHDRHRAQTCHDSVAPSALLSLAHSDCTASRRACPRSTAPIRTKTPRLARAFSAERSAEGGNRRQNTTRRCFLM